MKSNEIGFNYSECVKSKSNLTETTYINICDGKITTVKYGTLDIITIIVIGTILITLTIALIVFIINIIKEMINNGL